MTLEVASPKPRTPSKTLPWNHGRLIGQKPPLKLREVWAIRIRLQIQGRRMRFTDGLLSDFCAEACSLDGSRLQHCSRIGKR